MENLKLKSKNYLEQIINFLIAVVALYIGFAVLFNLLKWSTQVFGII